MKQKVSFVFSSTKDATWKRFFFAYIIRVKCYVDMCYVVMRISRSSLLIKILIGVHVRSRNLSTQDFTLNNNINRDSGIEIPEAWMAMIKIHNYRRGKTADR